MFYVWCNRCGLVMTLAWTIHFHCYIRSGKRTKKINYSVFGCFACDIITNCFFLQNINISMFFKLHFLCIAFLHFSYCANYLRWLLIVVYLFYNIRFMQPIFFLVRTIYSFHSCGFLYTGGVSGPRWRSFNNDMCVFWGVDNGWKKKRKKETIYGIFSKGVEYVHWIKTRQIAHQNNILHNR